MWIASRKTVGQGSWDSVKPVSGITPSTPFQRPCPLRDITFRPAEFFMAVGRAVTGRSAPNFICLSQAISSFVMITALMKSSKSELRLNSPITYLNEVKVNQTAHDLGVGTAFLVAKKLGFHWFDLADDHIGPFTNPKFKNKKCPDMLFETGAARGPFIAMEAKGTTRSRTKVNEVQFERRIAGACKNQVGNVIGHKTHGGVEIVHGYAIGLCAPRTGEASTFHVRETEIAAQVPATTDAPSPRTTPPMPTLATAARTALTAGLLIGDVDLIRRSIDWRSTRRKRWDLPDPDTSSLSFVQSDLSRPRRGAHLDRWYRLGPSFSAQLLGLELDGSFSFGIEEQASKQISDQLEDDDSDFSTVVAFNRRLRDDESEDGRHSVVDEDGLALIYSKEIN